MSAHSFDATMLFLVDGEETEMDCTVQYEFYGAYRGARDSCGGVRGAGPALEPDEPAHCEVLSVTILDDQAPNQDKTRDVTDQLTASEMEKLETEALEQHAAMSEPDPDAARERMNDDRF